MRGAPLIVAGWLVGATAALALVLGGRPDPSPDWEPRAEAEAPPDFTWSPPGSPLSDAWARPLFARDRRPPSAPPSARPRTPARPAPTTPARIRLLGVFQAGDRAAALLATDADTSPRWMSVGESVAGAELLAIHRDRVAIRLAGRVRSIVLRRAHPPTD